MSAKDFNTLQNLDADDLSDNKRASIMLLQKSGKVSKSEFKTKLGTSSQDNSPKKLTDQKEVNPSRVKSVFENWYTLEKQAISEKEKRKSSELHSARKLGTTPRKNSEPIPREPTLTQNSKGSFVELPTNNKNKKKNTAPPQIKTSAHTSPTRTDNLSKDVDLTPKTSPSNENVTNVEEKKEPPKININPEVHETDKAVEKAQQDIQPPEEPKVEKIEESKTDELPISVEEPKTTEQEKPDEVMPKEPEPQHEDPIPIVEEPKVESPVPVDEPNQIQPHQHQPEDHIKVPELKPEEKVVTSPSKLDELFAKTLDLPVIVDDEEDPFSRVESDDEFDSKDLGLVINMEQKSKFQKLKEEVKEENKHKNPLKKPESGFKLDLDAVSPSTGVKTKGLKSSSSFKDLTASAKALLSPKSKLKTKPSPQINVLDTEVVDKKNMFIHSVEKPYTKPKEEPEVVKKKQRSQTLAVQKVPKIKALMKLSSPRTLENSTTDLFTKSLGVDNSEDAKLFDKRKSEAIDPSMLSQIFVKPKTNTKIISEPPQQEESPLHVPRNKSYSMITPSGPNNPMRKSGSPRVPVKPLQLEKLTHANNLAKKLESPHTVIESLTPKSTPKDESLRKEQLMKELQGIVVSIQSISTSATGTPVFSNSPIANSPRTTISEEDIDEIVEEISNKPEFKEAIDTKKREFIQSLYSEQSPLHFGGSPAPKVSEDFLLEVKDILREYEKKMIEKLDEPNVGTDKNINKDKIQQVLNENIEYLNTKNKSDKKDGPPQAYQISIESNGDLIPDFKGRDEKPKNEKDPFEISIPGVDTLSPDMSPRLDSIDNSFPLLSPRTVQILEENISQKTIDAIIVIQRKMRLRIARRKLVKVAKSRPPIVKEIESTEKSYVKQLEEMLNYSRNILKKKVLDQNQFNSMFSNIENIYQLNVQLLRNIEDRIEYNTFEIELTTRGDLTGREQGNLTGRGDNTGREAGNLTGREGSNPTGRENKRTEKKNEKGKGTIFNKMGIARKRSIKPENMDMNTKDLDMGNTNILPTLNSKYLWKPEQTIGEIFCYYIPHLKIYSVYLNNYSQASEQFKKLKSESKVFQEFLSKHKADFKLKDLTTLMIEPVQRLPRYQMLLNTLLKYTPKEHYDFENLTKAVEMINEVNQYLNEKKRMKDTQIALLKLNTKFSIDLYQVGHRNIVDQLEVKVSLNSSPWIRCECYLFTDILYVFNVDDEPKKMKRALHLSFCSISEEAHPINDKIVEFKFLIGNLHFEFEFEAKGTAIKWRNRLIELVNNELKETSEFSQADLTELILARPTLTRELEEKKEEFDRTLLDYEKNTKALKSLSDRYTAITEEIKTLPLEIRKTEVLTQNSKKRVETVSGVINSLTNKTKENQSNLAKLLRNDENSIKLYFGEKVQTPRKIKYDDYLNLPEIPRFVENESSTSEKKSSTHEPSSEEVNIFNLILNEKLEELEKVNSELSKLQAEKTKLLNVIVQRTKYYTTELNDSKDKLSKAEEEIAALKAELLQLKQK